MNLRSLMAVALVSLTAVVVAPSAAAQASSTVISGVVEYRGEPIAGIVVGWVDPTTGNLDSVLSKSDGTYALSGPSLGHRFIVYANLEMGDFQQSIKSSNYLGTFYGLGNKRSYAFQSLVPYTAGDAEAVSIELAKPARLTGSDPALALQRIRLRTVGDDLVYLSDGADSVRADASGTFVFPRLVPGSFVLENPSRDTIAGVRTEPIPVTEGTTTTVDPLVDTGATVRGRVTDGGGKPVAHVPVAAGTGNKSRAGYTDSDGRYTIRALAESNFTVQFGGPEQSYSRVPSTKKVVVSGVTSGSTRVVNARVTAGAKLNGRVRDSATTITLLLDSHKRFVSGSFGSAKYSFSGLDDGHYSLVLRDLVTKRYHLTRVTLTRGTTTTLGAMAADRTGVTLSGHVNARGSIQALATTSNTGDVTKIDEMLGGSARISSTGKYTVRGLIPGRYDVIVESDRREDHVYPAVAVTGRTRKNLSTGAEQSTVRALVTFNEDRPDEVHIEAKSDRRTISTDFYGGSLVAWADPGTYAFTYVEAYPYADVYSQGFQPGSPFWLSVPEAQKFFTVEKGVDLHLGTIELVVNDH